MNQCNTGVQYSTDIPRQEGEYEVIYVMRLNMS